MINVIFSSKVPCFDDQVKTQIREKLVDEAGFNTSNIYTYMRQVEAVCTHQSLVSVFELDSQGSQLDMDLAILNAILQGMGQYMFQLSSHYQCHTARYGGNMRFIYLAILNAILQSMGQYVFHFPSHSQCHTARYGAICVSTTSSHSQCHTARYGAICVSSI